ncbi:MAG: hypothetical protein ABI374_04455 [Ginsengibacter sp.]
MELYSSFDDRREDSTDYAPPANFTKAYNDIVSLFGNPTRTELATGFDSLFFRETGMPRLVEWECSHILLQLRVRYGGNTKGLNGLGIQITDRNFDYIENIREAE